MVHRRPGSLARRRGVGEPKPLTAAETDEGSALCDSEDYREGLRAFLAKEKPAFRGR